MTVAACWVEMVAVEASASVASGVVLESSIAALETEGAAPALASTAGSSVVI
jgi:hypothetical protein